MIQNRILELVKESGDRGLSGAPLLTLMSEIYDIPEDEVRRILRIMIEKGQIDFGHKFKLIAKGE